MNDHHKPAEVISLTAEVRVLKVGNRQITQSVAKQLDVVLPQFVEPFGRVRIGTGSNTEEIIIGRCNSKGRRTNLHGTLVTARYCRALHNVRRGDCPRRPDPADPDGVLYSTCAHGTEVTPFVRDNPHGEGRFLCCDHLAAEGACGIQKEDCPYGPDWRWSLDLIVLAGLR